MQNIKNLMAIGRISAVIGVAALAGCSSMKSSSSDDHRSEGRVEDDKRITKTVEKKLKSDPVYKFESVNVKTYGGVVQLSGFVDSQVQSRRAEEIALNVGGVSQLINGLALKPQPMPRQPVPTQALMPAQTLVPTGQASGERLAPKPAPPTTPSPDSPAQKE